MMAQIAAGVNPNRQEVKMKATILDGSQTNDMTGERVRTALMAQLEVSGWEVEHVIIRDQKIGNCAGDFFCWVRSPGLCNINDDNRRIAQAMIASELTVYLTPVTFGGYSSMLKRMVDHQIQNVSPFFAKVDGETHLRKRYDKYPDFLVVGWMDEPDAQAEAIFRHLVRRNCINFYTEKAACGIVLASQSDDDISASVENWLNDIRNGQMLQTVNLPESNNTHCSASRIRRALLLVGSPKTHKSTSNSLGGYLTEQLDAQSIQTETVYLHTIVHSPEKMKALLETVDTADLITLAFPLYVDSLPAPVIDVLERIAMHRQSREHTHRPLFTAISNCGYPETQHNATALAICEAFAKQAQFEWAGSLALGGGGMIDGTPLAEMGGRTIRIRKSLELAATALAKGQAIPKAAQDLMSKPVIPAWAYRLLGNLHWKKVAKSYGVGKSLKRQPFLA